MSNWSKQYNDIYWQNESSPYLSAANLNENQSWIKELDSRTKELYARTDTAEPGGIARDVYFDNSTSGLDADNVQDAIDEVESSVNALNSFVNGMIFVSESLRYNVSFDAGTIGTRCISADVDISKSGYTILTANLLNSSVSGSFDTTLMARPDTKKLQIRCYRATASAVSGAYIQYQIIYLKNAVSTLAEG